MIRKSDIQWWVLEAKKHPESAPTIIEELAERLTELDAENERLRDEIIQLQRRGPAATDSAEVSALRQKVATLQSLLDSLSDGTAPTQLSVAFFSYQLQSASISLSQVQRLVEEGRPVLGRQALLGVCCLLLVRPHEEMLLLTSRGHGLRVQPSDLPLLVEGTDWPVAEGQVLAADERLTASVAVGEPPRFWTVVTRRGYVQPLIHIDFDRKGARGDPLVESPFRNDAPVAIVNGDQGDLMLFTRWGKWVRFSHRAIAGQGSVALELEPDDEVAAALSLPSDAEIVIATAAGYAMRRDTARLEARSRPGGKGKTLIQAFDVLGAFPYESEAQLLYLAYSGKLTLVAVKDIPLHERFSKGTQVCPLDRDQAVAVALVPAMS